MLFLYDWPSHLVTACPIVQCFTNMSWMKDLAGGERPHPYVDDSTEKIADPSNPNRMVSNKKANRPFLACVFMEWWWRVTKVFALFLFLKISGVPSGTGGITRILVGKEESTRRSDYKRRKSRASGTWPHCSWRSGHSRTAQVHHYCSGLYRICWEIYNRELLLGGRQQMASSQDVFPSKSRWLPYCFCSAKSSIP